MRGGRARAALSAASLVVLSVTVLALALAKVRAARAPRAPSSTTAAAVVSLGASSAASPPIGVDEPLGPAPVSEDVTTFHGDAARTHRARGRAPRAPREKWRATLGGPVVAQPVLSRDQSTVFVTSLDGKLYAVERGSGAIKWRVDLGDRAYGTPLVDEIDRVYVGSDAKKLSCVRGGTIAWTLDLDGEADTAPLLVSRDRIAITAGASISFVTLSGEVKARFRAKRKIFTSPALGSVDGAPVVFFGSQDHRAYAVRFDGTLAWSTDLGADVDGGPVVTASGVVFGTDAGNVVALDLARGERVWSTPLGGFVRGGLTVGRDGSVLAGVYGPTPGVVRLAGATGAIRGKFSVPGTGSRDFGVHGSPLEDDDGTLVFGAEDDRVYALERSGRLRFAVPRGGDVDAPVTLTRDGALIIGADDGTVAELSD